MIGSLTINFDFPEVFQCNATPGSQGHPSTIFIDLHSDDQLSGFAVMDSELRKTLLKAPNTSASIALVRALDS